MPSRKCNGWVRFAFLAALFAPFSVIAETLLCIPGIAGPVTFEFDNDCIEVLGFGEDLNVQPAPAGGGAALIEFGPIKVIKGVDMATPVLFVNAAKQTVYESVAIHFLQECGGDRYPHYRIDLLQNVLITRVAQTGGSGLPTEQVEFEFSRIRWSFTPLDGECKSPGTIERTWDLTTHQEF